MKMTVSPEAQRDVQEDSTQSSGDQVHVFLHKKIEEQYRCRKTREFIEMEVHTGEENAGELRTSQVEEVLTMGIIIYPGGGGALNLMRSH